MVMESINGKMEQSTEGIGTTELEKERERWSTFKAWSIKEAGNKTRGVDMVNISIPMETSTLVIGKMDSRMDKDSMYFLMGK